MSCNCCCTKVLSFCKQAVCDEIDFDILAQTEGVHRLVTYFKEIKITIEAEFDLGDRIVFPLSGLNENFLYTVELYDPNDTRILIQKGGLEYDCFKFQTSLNVTYS